MNLPGVGFQRIANQVGTVAARPAAWIPLLLVMCLATAFGAASAGEAPAPPSRAAVEQLIGKAQAWLLAQSQPEGAIGSGKTFAVGITAFAVIALRQQPQRLPDEHPALGKSVAFLAGFRQPDGGVYDRSEGLAVYGTSLALQAATLLPDGHRARFDQPAMQRYLFGQQNTEPGNLGQGGIGYGDQGKGFEDLSNTGYALQALRASGVPASDPRMQAAVAFLERCQDLSAVNHQPWVGKTSGDNGAGSGGGVYGPQEAARSWSKGDETQAGRWTPSGTMTYELISSYLLLDLKPDDQRVKAARQWLARNYGFDANPGMGTGKERQGLFHSYALASTTYDLLASATVDLPDGRQADWRSDLFQALSKRAQSVTLADGSTGAFWINDAPRWAEGMPALCTAYALRSLKAVARSLP
ncbi:cycloartenol synthase [Planctomycetota bacterium]|nr:cycloartenol synthase [Planctomycetota bacterium]